MSFRGGTPNLDLQGGKLFFSPKVPQRMSNFIKELDNFFGNRGEGVTFWIFFIEGFPKPKFIVSVNSNRSPKCQICRSDGCRGCPSGKCQVTGERHISI